MSNNKTNLIRKFNNIRNTFCINLAFTVCRLNYIYLSAAGRGGDKLRPFRTPGE